MHTVRTSATVLALLLAMAATGSAQSDGAQSEQDKAQAELKAKLDAKLKEPFVANAPWVLDYAEAMKKAKEEKKLILAYFTRSYAP